MAERRPSPTDERKRPEAGETGDAERAGGTTRSPADADIERAGGVRPGRCAPTSEAGGVD